MLHIDTCWAYCDDTVEGKRDKGNPLCTISYVGA